TRITVRQAVRGYIDIKKNVLSPATIRGYEIILDNRLQSVMPLDIHDLDSFAMQKAINEDAATKSRKTIAEGKNLVIAALKMYGIRPDFVVTLPPKKPNMKVLPTADQVIRMIRGTEIELPCILAMWLSLRMSEVRGLQFGDIKDGVLTVQRSKLNIKGKDVVREVNKTYNSTRRLVVPAYIQSLIDAVPHERDEDFIVPQAYEWIRGRLKKLAKANVYDLTFHQLRHLNASVMLMLGIPDKYAMERGGWSSNGVLKSVYQHTFSEERKLVDERIDGFFDALLNG
ncbi:MAG: site-specific integrase, partial [Oscillospiraceae bacterium]|nr:site-specific integrase [Oscillospiraceae bacterium]